MLHSYIPVVALMLAGAGRDACFRLAAAGVEVEEALAMLETAMGRRLLGEKIGATLPEVPWERLREQVASMADNGVAALAYHDDRYPEHLRDIPEPPPVLFYRGDPDTLGERGVAVVGTRSATARGCGFARELARDLAECGVVVVSGMARGIDAYAHRGALDRAGATVAFLGTGLDICFPAENRGLMDEIASSGCIAGEQLMGTPGLRHAFTRGNRLISGAAHAVVVVEAPLRSGALVTARWALEQGRDVGAVPGFPGDPRSRGVNNLIKQGAFAVESVEDIFEAVPLLAARAPARSAPERSSDRERLTAEEQAVIDAIGAHATDADLLAERLDVPVAGLQQVLVRLELKGLVMRDAAGFYTRN